MARPGNRRGADPKKAVAYMRVSTDRERQELGAEAQRAAIAGWAAREGVEVVGWYSEEVSGGAPLEKRSVLVEAIAALRGHGAGLLVFQRLDRNSRDPLTAALAEMEVIKAGARLVSADGVGNGTDPASQLMRDIGLAAARFERAMISMRTKAALAVKKQRGESTGTPPYGYRVGPDGRRLERDAREQSVLEQVRGLRRAGMSYRSVRKAATDLGLLGRTGRAFTLQAIFAMTAKGSDAVDRDSHADSVDSRVRDRVFG